MTQSAGAERLTVSFLLDDVNFAKGGGLVPVVAQDVITGSVLMVAFADRTALARTIETGEMHYHSRSRGLWHKGGTSGNVQRVVSLHLDCDADTVLARVAPAGPACHTGEPTCFEPLGRQADVLSTLDAVIEARANEMPDPERKPSYTRRLLGDRNLRLKKIGEEAAEFVTACADGDRTRATEEAADLFYHVMVALRATGVTLDDVRRVLGGRAS
ncbi:MAG: bifunctional phosphoribosyl-AMP cyclohydrolase/phosphoribosyl-ATP diphosphatase HisIE [Gemmatimonadaceae bacterium]|nr:bifunctional phosphoribosyl-AMP cyclohydrolase/phosphoribosyl-ATP diphosphatase HisIE [Gemmatimonadaceae bacterium]